MPKNVIGAFNDFMDNKVNLDKEQTKKARASRDWLVEQIINFPTNNEDFPSIYTAKNIFYGSFARNTKKRPLDDIDIIIALNAQGSTYSEYSDRIEINVSDDALRLKKMCNQNTKILNSNKVINKFVNDLKNIPQYKNAEIHKNGEAATLQLVSYDWNFDIVPAFFTTEDSSGRTYYLMPDKNGNWKKTDPRIDKDRVFELNKKNDGFILNVIRATKYWNNRPTMPTMGSYLLENMVLDYYESQLTTASQFVDIEMVKIFEYIKTAVYNTVNDPKKIQGNINDLTWEKMNKISERAKSDFEKSKIARQFESDKQDENSINKWREVFGDEFPKYE